MTTRAEKIAAAKEWLRSRGRYLLDGAKWSHDADVRAAIAAERARMQTTKPARLRKVA